LKRVVLAAALLAALAARPAEAGDAPDNQATVRDCITAAAKVYRLPPAVLVILLNVERGLLGRVSPNTNGTVDIGPIQVNEIWLPEVAAHWHATIADTYKALRDNFCANVEAGAWILRRSLDEAHGDFWEGVGYYHSHTPEHKTRYLRDVLRQVVHLRTLVEHAVTSAPPNVVQVTAPPLAPERRPSD
jgi:hypothetical protein